MTPLVAMTVTAGAASAPLKKPPVAQKIAPKSTVPFERSAFDVEDQEHAIIPGFPDALLGRLREMLSASHARRHGSLAQPQFLFLRT